MNTKFTGKHIENSDVTGVIFVGSNPTERFNEIENTDVIITKSSGYPLILFMRDQEVLDYIKVEK